MVLQQPLHASFVLRPSHRPQQLHLEYTHRELTVPARLPTAPTTTTTTTSSSHEDDDAVRLPLAAIQSSPTTTAAVATAATYEDVVDDEEEEDDSSFPPPRAVKRSRTTVLPWNKAIHTIPNLQSEFEPPSDANYWKQRCFHWQSICQETRQKLREMQEDQRQLRKRLWQLEEQVVWAASRTSTPSLPRDTTLAAADPLPVATSSTQVPVSPTSQDHQKRPQRPPQWIVTIPTTRKCCFYLTDSEGLSDSEYADDDDIMNDIYPPDDDEEEEEEDENNDKDNDRNDEPQQQDDDENDHRETNSHGKDHAASTSSAQRQDCPQEPSCNCHDSPNKTFTATNDTSNSPSPDPALEQADSKCTDDAVVGIKTHHHKNHIGTKSIKREPARES